MYVANQHRIPEAEALEFARRNGNGELISIYEGKIQSTHVPFIIVKNSDGPNDIMNDGRNNRTDIAAQTANNNTAAFHLETHLSQVNPQWRGAGESEALLVVNIADQHVPGHFLPAEREFDRLPQAPTWNYLTVHIRGSFEAIHDSDWKLAHLSRFVHHFEPVWRAESHSNYERLNHALPALVGIRMQIREIVGKAKLHQQLDSPQISDLAEKLTNSDPHNPIPQLMHEIAVPWAKNRESRVAYARTRKTLPVINPSL
ncbi:FMN-binding negative transcriptional regulator [Arcanobacterium hippocoleae]